jgi:hypothetical protein
MTIGCLLIGSGNTTQLFLRSVYPGLFCTQETFNVA